MKNKIIKPALLLAACFVMQMTGAMSMDAAQAKQKLPAPAAKGAELSLGERIQKIEADLLEIRGQVARYLQEKLPEKVNGVESSEALRSLIKAKKAALDVAKAEVKRTYVLVGRNLEGYDKFYANQKALEKEILILEAAFPTIEKYERDPYHPTHFLNVQRIGICSRESAAFRMKRKPRLNRDVNDLYCFF